MGDDGITRSGSFGPAAELKEAHTEIERLKAENERLRTTPEMAGHTWCKLERALAAEAENERLRAEARELSEEADAYQMQRDAAEARLATAEGLIDAYMADDDYDAQGCINRVRAALASAQPAAPARAHDRDDCDNPDCGTCMFNEPAAPARQEQPDEGPDHGEADPDYPPHRYLFEGEPEKCALCGEAGHVHDDHFSPPLAARLAAAEAKIAKLEEPNLDDPLWLRNEVRRLRGVVKDLYDRILHPNGRCTCGGGGGGSCDWCLQSMVAEASITDDEWKELDPER